MGQQRLCAVMAGSDIASPSADKNFADIVGMHALHGEGYDAGMFLGLVRTGSRECRAASAMPSSVRAGQRRFLLMHGLKAHAEHILDGGLQDPPRPAAFTVPASNLWGSSA